MKRKIGNAPNWGKLWTGRSPHLVCTEIISHIYESVNEWIVAYVSYYWLGLSFTPHFVMLYLIRNTSVRSVQYLIPSLLVHIPTLLQICIKPSNFDENNKAKEHNMMKGRIEMWWQKTQAVKISNTNICLQINELIMNSFNKWNEAECGKSTESQLGAWRRVELP